MTYVFVTLRPPCSCPSEGNKHCVSIQSSIILGDTLLRIAHEWKTAETWYYWRGCLYCNHLSYPRFLNLFIERLQFLVLITWLRKPENMNCGIRQSERASPAMKSSFEFPASATPNEIDRVMEDWCQMTSLQEHLKAVMDDPHCFTNFSLFVFAEQKQQFLELTRFGNFWHDVTTHSKTQTLFSALTHGQLHWASWLKRKLWS